METLGQRIAELRKKKGVTQDALAEEMGVTSQAVSKWENDISCPDISLLPKLSEYLGVSIDELLRGSRASEIRLTPATEKVDTNRLIFRINVLSSDGDKVKVNIPVSLMQVALETGAKVDMFGSASKALGGIDFAQLMLMAESGVIGKLVEVQSADGDTVDITVEKI